MQDVKFKVFCNTHNRWEFYSLGDLVCGATTSEAGEGDFRGETWKQFTGLEDQNGTEIYNGDIVSFHKRMYEVAINFNGFYLQRYKLWRGKFVPAFQYSMSLFTSPRKLGDQSVQGGKVKDVEVVGNCFDTPELMTKIHDT